MRIAHIPRNKDVVDGKEDLERLYTFESFPVFMGCSTEHQSHDLVSDMTFWISRGSGMIQLNPLLPLDVLYSAAHGAGCVGSSWAQHHQALADFIARFTPLSVLEIGGAHGILATNYQRNRPIPWTILEPNPTPVEECKAEFITGFFDENFNFPAGVDAVVHSHVFEHFYNPDLFVKHLANFLPRGKHLIFSVPNMRVMMERKFTNCLNFEHSIYLSETYIDLLLTRNGFLIVEKQYFLDDHSIFFCAVRDDGAQTIERDVNLYDTNKRLYLDYIDSHEILVSDINRRLADVNPGNAYLFGAHVQAQYLIGFGLDTTRISAILDNDSNKHGKRLSGTDKLVLGPEVLAGQKSPLVVIRAGTFTPEIVAQIRGINPSTQFVF